MAEFDWVKALAACSVVEMFVRLKSGVARDVEARARVKGDAFTFKLTTDAPLTFVVFRDGVPPMNPDPVRFTANAIDIAIVSEKGELEFTVRPTLNDHGECRCLVDGRELDEWQVRKRALEALFFGPMF